jgi:hypothetical protein
MAKVASIELSDFDGVSMNFIWRSSSENCSERIYQLLKNFRLSQLTFQRKRTISQANGFISKSRFQYHQSNFQLMGVK